MSSEQKFRVHVIGLPHTVTNKDFIACAFTIKCLRICKMLHNRGHEIIHYGNEGATVDATEIVDLCSKEELYNFYGYSLDPDDTAWKSKQFQHNVNDNIYVKFNNLCLQELMKRIRPGDIVGAFFGRGHAQTFDRLPSDVIKVELGIGYGFNGAMKDTYKVHESNSGLSRFTGESGSMHPNSVDTVIPNYFDPEDFDFDLDSRIEISGKPINDGYWLAMGRMITDKGMNDAYKACKLLDCKLKVAGQGTLYDAQLPSSDDNVEYLGHVDVEQRRKLLAGAKGVITFSKFLEPFCGVSIEALMSGVPVIACRFGALTENIVHGIVGFNVNDVSGMVTAMYCCSGLNPKIIRDYAINNYSIDAVAPRYEEFFSRISMHNLYGSSVVHTLGRISNLNIYNKYIEGLTPLKTKPINDYTYSFGFFGLSSPTILPGTCMVVTPSNPSLDDMFVVDEDFRGVQRDFKMPATMDYLRGTLVIDDSEHKDKFGMYTTTALKKWAGILNDDGSVNGIRKINTLHSEYDAYVTHDLIMMFNPDILVLHHNSARNWSIYGYRVTSTNDNGPLTLIRDNDCKKKAKVAIWTEDNWAMGRIARGLQKYSKKCDIDIIDWSDPNANMELWTSKWVSYVTITGNGSIMTFPWSENGWLKECPTRLKSKLRPTIHTSLTNNKWYNEEMTHMPTCMSAISLEVQDVLAKKTTSDTVIHVTKPGVDLELFPLTYKPTCIRTIGFVGTTNLPEYALDIKRPSMAKEIADAVGAKLKMINGYTLDDGADMYEGIDLLICCSTSEGGPLGLFEAAACGIPILTTCVGNIKDVDGVCMFESKDEAVDIIKGWNDDTVELCRYRDHVTNVVREKWNWESLIDVWDSFLLCDEDVIRKSLENKVSHGVVRPITDPEIYRQFNELTGSNIPIPNDK